MDLDKLQEQFLVDEDVKSEKLGQIIQKLLPYCVVSKKGMVDIRKPKLAGKAQVKLVLAARLVASKIEGSSVTSGTSLEEIVEYTGLPKDQVSARAKECVDDGFAERAGRGSYKARQHRIESFVDELSVSSGAEGRR
jgi:hypothetical protein